MISYSPKGHLFCKTCIYECLLLQRKKRKEEKKKLEDNKLKLEEEMLSKQEELEKKKIEEFDKVSNSLKFQKEEKKETLKLNAYWLV